MRTVVRTLEGVARWPDVELLLEALEILHQGRERLGSMTRSRMVYRRARCARGGWRACPWPFLSHPAPWVRSRARVLGSRPDGVTSTASLKNTASLKKANVESAKSLDPRPRSRADRLARRLLPSSLRYPRKEDSTMKRRLALVAVLGGALLAFGVQN